MSRKAGDLACRIEHAFQQEGFPYKYNILVLQLSAPGIGIQPIKMNHKECQMEQKKHDTKSRSVKMY